MLRHLQEVLIKYFIFNQCKTFQKYLITFEAFTLIENNRLDQVNLQVANGLDTQVQTVRRQTVRALAERQTDRQREKLRKRDRKTDKERDRKTGKERDRVRQTKRETE